MSWSTHSTTSKEIISFQREVSKTLEAVQQQLYMLEESYYENTPYGNVSKGWEGYADSRPRRGLDRNKRLRPSERVFSYSSSSAPFLPSDLAREEALTSAPQASARRKLPAASTGTSASGSAAASSNFVAVAGASMPTAALRAASSGASVTSAGGGASASGGSARVILANQEDVSRSARGGGGRSRSGRRKRGRS